jgi:hypothetical protein
MVMKLIWGKKKLGWKINVMSLRGGELLIASKFLLVRNLPTHYLEGFVGTSKTPKGNVPTN